VLALLGCHAAVAGRGARAELAGAAPERLLRRPRERAEAHSRDRDRDIQVQRLAREATPDHDVGGAALAIALERIARDGRAEEQQVVEMRHAALGAEAADVVDPLARGALDLGDRAAVEGRGLAQAGVPAIRDWRARLRCAVLGHSVAREVVDVEVVERAGSRSDESPPLERHRARLARAVA